MFPQEIGQAYTTADGLPSDDVNAVARTAEGRVYAGTAKGLARLDGGRWTRVEAVPAEPVHRLAAAGSCVYVATGTALYRLDRDESSVRLVSLPSVPSALTVGADRIWIGTAAGLFEVDRKKVSPVTALNAHLGTGAHHTASGDRAGWWHRGGRGCRAVSTCAGRLETPAATHRHRELGGS